MNKYSIISTFTHNENIRISINLSLYTTSLFAFRAIKKRPVDKLSLLPHTQYYTITSFIQQGPVLDYAM